MALNNNDYKTILDYYGIEHMFLTNKELKRKAEHILANKLCQCIKKVTKRGMFKTEQPAIAICTNSIFKKRNLKYKGFVCRGKPSLTGEKNERLTKQRKGSVQFSKKQTRRKTLPPNATTHTRRKAKSK